MGRAQTESGFVFDHRRLISPSDSSFMHLSFSSPHLLPERRTRSFSGLRRWCIGVEIKGALRQNIVYNSKKMNLNS